MKKRIALLLSFVLVLSLALCACGEKKEPTVVGTWKADINLAEAFNQEMEAADMGEFINVESFNLPLILELKEDGTGAMRVDADAMTATMERLAADLTAGLEAYFVEMYASMGLEVDIDQLLAESGISMEDLVSEMTASFSGEEAFAEFTTEFNYKAEDGKLYMSEDLETEIDIAVYNTYTLDGDTMTLEVGTEQLDEEMAQYMFPMTLTRSK